MVCRLFGILLIVAAAAVQGFTPRKSIALTRKQEQDEPHVSRGVDKGTLQVDTTLGAGTCSSTTETALRLSRGGGFASAIANIFVILVRNPGLLIVAAASTAIKLFEEQIPYPKFLNAAVQLVGAGYVFHLLTKWQDSIERAES